MPQLMGIKVENYMPASKPWWSKRDSGNLMANSNEDRPFIVRHWSTFTTVVGLTFSLTLWCLLFNLLAEEDKTVGIYLVFAVTIMTFLESTFIFHHFFFSRGPKSTKIYKAWEMVLWVDSWKRGFLYIALSIPSYIKANLFKSGLCLATGVLITLLGMFHAVQLFRDKNQKPQYRYVQLEI